MAKKAAPKKFEGFKFTTGQFRASYLTVFEPKAFEDGAEEKYSCDMLFPKKMDITDLKKFFFKVAKSAWGPDKTKWPKNYQSPIKDGDEKEDAGGYADHWYVRTDSKNPPGIVDRKGEDIEDKRMIFSGCYCRASLFVKPYQNIGGRSGLKCYFQGIQLLKKGEPFGESFNAADAFDELDEDADGDSDSDDSDLDDMGF